MILESKPKVMTEKELQKLRESLSIPTKTAGATALIFGTIHASKAISPVVDGVVSNVGISVINIIDNFFIKMTTPVTFPYVFSIPMWHILSGAAGLITLMILFVSVKGKNEKKSTKEIVFECCCILLPPVFWLLIGGI